MLMSQNNADNTLTGRRHEAQRLRRRGDPRAEPAARRRQGRRQLRGRHQPAGVPHTKNKDAGAEAGEVPDQPRGAGHPGQAVHCPAGGQRAARANFTTDAREAKAFADVLATKAEPLPLLPAESAFETNVGNAVNGLLAQAATGKAVSDADIKAALQEAQDKMAAAGS